MPNRPNVITIHTPLWVWMPFAHKWSSAIPRQYMNILWWYYKELWSVSLNDLNSHSWYRVIIWIYCDGIMKDWGVYSWRLFMLSDIMIVYGYNMMISWKIARWDISCNWLGGMKVKRYQVVNSLLQWDNYIFFS